MPHEILVFPGWVALWVAITAALLAWFALVTFLVDGLLRSIGRR